MNKKCLILLSVIETSHTSFVKQAWIGESMWRHVELDMTPVRAVAVQCHK
jgi:hypothetical protein